MSWPGRLETALSVVLRVPPLFLLDSVLNKSFLAFVFPYDPSMSWQQFIFWLAFMGFVFMIGIVMFVMSIRQLLRIYSYVVNIVVLALSFWWNHNFVIEVQDEDAVIEEGGITFQRRDLVYKHFFAQFFFAWLFYMAWDMRRSSDGLSNFAKSAMQTLVHLSFISPIVIDGLFKMGFYREWSPLLAIVYPVIHISHDILDSLSTVYFSCKRMYNIVRVTVSAIGIQAFIEDQWMRLHVPRVLRLFFVTRVTYQLTVYVSSIYYDTPPKMHLENATEEYKHENLTLILQNLLVRSCETFVSLLGTTSVVSFIAHYIGLIMAFCVGSDTEEDRNMGTVSAILFFLLALQTGLTGLEPVKRLVRLYRNFALLSAAILHFVHSMVNPILLSLSASHSLSVRKHLRVLAMCAFLVIYPVCLVTYLWQHHSASPWLLAVTAFSIEVIIKVIVSLMVYTLFMIDAYRDTFWEKLDDYIYYIQSTGNTIEFLFGIFMFCNGGWIMLFESGGAIRAVMMCVHAYLNIFVQAKEGWKVFMKRRTAVNKINSLREATKEELEAFNDVCAICYQELKTARVTRCNHYYHSVCLRKWLYVQDNCPLCHEVLYKPPGEQNGETNRSSENMDEANQNDILNDNREPPGYNREPGNQQH